MAMDGRTGESILKEVNERLTSDQQGFGTGHDEKCLACSGGRAESWRSSRQFALFPFRVISGPLPSDEFGPL
jgi:hypothetical protein